MEQGACEHLSPSSAQSPSMSPSHSGKKPEPSLWPTSHNLFRHLSDLTYHHSPPYSSCFSYTGLCGP